MTGYYLGVAVTVDPGEPVVDGWVWATWPDGRRFKHWAEQIKTVPWGDCQLPS